MTAVGNPIEAVLTLNATSFHNGINDSVKAVDKLKTSIDKFSGDSTKIKTTLETVVGAVEDLTARLIKLNSELGSMTNINTFSMAVKRISDSIVALGDSSVNVVSGMNAVNEIFATLDDVLSKTSINVRGLKSALAELNSSEESNSQITKNLRNSYGESLNVLRQFHTGLNSGNQALLMVTNAMKQYELGATNVAMKNNTTTTSFNTMRNSVTTFSQTLNNTSKASKDFVTKFTQVEPIINNVSGEFARLKAEIGQVSESYRVLKINQEGENVTLEKSAVALEKNSQEMLKNAEAKLRAMGYTGELTALEQRLGVSETETATKTNQATSSIQRQSSAMNQASGSASRLTSSTNALSKALSSLKMVGTLVASMMVWNFASSLVNATRETVNAKSEMEGYFKMLHFSQGEINEFNDALSRTVQQFQRVNKYSLGETISSIGVEFDLSTKEMEKAMKVTSMITSEYLRAGRNANEASLAVKDVLQGQFQRLSRETGVKGEQLKDAGWSGDTTDVLGLMEALEKVGESRNWDVFAQKANSLNDIVTILQNRFGEWSADMVYAVQPTIVGVFNTLMSVFGMFGNVVGGIWEWLNTDGIAQNIIKWTGLATAITSVVSALVVYRTGASLTQIAQMGLRGSIIATTLGLEAETVATHGSKVAIVSRLTSLEAEKVAEMGVKNAIASKILGLNAEKVAQFSLKGAIVESWMAREYETAVRSGANVSELTSIALHYKELQSKLTTTQAIYTHILGLKAETVAQKGGIVALAERIATSPLYIGSLEAEEVAELSTAEASLVLAGTLAPLVAIFVGLAVAVYSVVKPLQDASAEMKHFNELIQSGDESIKSARRTMDSYSSRASELEKELQGLTKGTDEYIRKNRELDSVNANLDTAKKNWEDITKAVELARSSQNHFDTRKDEIAIETQTKLAKAYEDMGISAQKAHELASHELNEAKKGAEQLRQALARIKYESDVGVEKQTAVMDMLKAYGLDDETLEKYGTNMSEARNKITEGFEKMMTSDDLMDRIGGWFEIQQGRLEEWWTELNAFFEVRDWGAIRDKLLEGVKYVLTGFGAFDWIGALTNTISEKGLVGAIMDALFGEGDSDGILDIIYDWANSMIVKPFLSWWDWFIEDPIGHYRQMSDDFAHGVAKFLFGKDEESTLGEMIDQWAYDTFVQPIVDWFNEFTSDPMGVIMNGGFTFGGIGILTSALPQLLFGEGTNLNDISSWINEWVSGIIPIIIQSLHDGVMRIPLVSQFLELFGLVDGENSGASNMAILLGKAIKGSLINVINAIPIVGTILQLLGLITGTYADARSKGQSVGDSIKQGLKAGVDGLAKIVTDEIDRIKKYLEDKAGEVYNSASNFGKNVVNGVKNALDSNSPGILAREVFPKEFGEYIPNAISNSTSSAYDVAKSYGQAIVDGVSSAQGNQLGLDGMVSEYQSDAQTVSMYSQMMGTETTTAFDEMNLAVNNTTATMSANVSSSYSTMQQKQSSLLQNMKTQNTTAYNEMYTKSNQSLLQMRDSTTNITNQMINAWDHMKVQLVATADALRNESTNHFNQLSSTIGSFYRKIQNPSNWGAGGTSVRSRSPNRSFGRSVASGLSGAGSRSVGRYSGSSTMTVSSLKKQLCPNGDCGTMFDGFNPTDKVDVETFLRSIEGEHGFGWSGWNGTHYNYIKNKSDQWDMASPVINLVGGIPTNTKFKVGEFNNGTPKVSFGAFQSIAESIFSRIPYKYYYDSSWKGSWLGALQSGACNCSDGADALIALASVFGFSGYKQWGTWDGEGHFWAVINGKPMDTTAWQGGYGWTSPKVSGYGSSNIRRGHGSGSNDTATEVHIHIDMSGSNNYGIDSIEDVVEEGVNKGLREHFNNPNTVLI